MKTVDDYLFSLPYNVLGALLRGSEYAENQNMDTDQEPATAEQTNIPIEAHQD